jgi:uncharacterized membrane protein
METWLHDWLSLLLRWAHFITGVAWIGASFYFNWLENELERHAADDRITGELWALHGGGFYYLQKYRVAPDSLPTKLHWFKYEAYFTWLTGLGLLAVVYYWNPSLYLLQSGPNALNGWQAVTLGAVTLVASWLIYDGLCRSPLRQRPLLLALCILGWFTLLAWGLAQVFSGRAAYLHVGAAIGTVMVANVAHVIIPAQRELVAAVAAGRRADAARGASALLRSRHNNYLTLPVLFLMISSHYPATYGHAHNWLILLVFSLAAVGIRHWFNIRHLPRDDQRRARWVLPASLLLMLALIAATVPWPSGAGAARDAKWNASPGTAAIMPVVAARCTGCHATEPGFAGFAEAPLGVVFETAEQVEAQAARIHQMTVVTPTMPPGNLTGMTPAERDLLDRWYRGRAH